jgi:hypothetical protein
MPEATLRLAANVPQLVQGTNGGGSFVVSNLDSSDQAGSDLYVAGSSTSDAKLAVALVASGGSRTVTTTGPIYIWSARAIRASVSGPFVGSVALASSRRPDVNGASNTDRPDGTLSAFGANTVFVARRRHVVKRTGWLTGLVYIGASGDGSNPTRSDAAIANDCGIRAAIVLAADPNVLLPLYFDGSRDGTLRLGEEATGLYRGGKIWVEKGDVFYSHSAYWSPTDNVADVYPRDSLYDATIEDFAQYTNANLATGKTKVDTAPWVPTGNSGKALYPPFARVNLPSPARVLLEPVASGHHLAIWADSRGDGNPNPYGLAALDDDGFVAIAAYELGFSFTRCSRGSSRSSDDLASNRIRHRAKMSEGATIDVYAHTQNDLANGVTIAQAQATALAFSRKRRGQGRLFVGTTCDPWTTSTDAWRTAASQTPVATNGYAARRTT